MLADTSPHEIERLFFGHCRMETSGARFNFAVDVTDAYAEAFKARSPLLVVDPTVFRKVRFG